MHRPLQAPINASCFNIGCFVTARHHRARVWSPPSPPPPPPRLWLRPSVPSLDATLPSALHAVSMRFQAKNCIDICLLLQQPTYTVCSRPFRLAHCSPPCSSVPTCRRMCQAGSHMHCRPLPHPDGWYVWQMPAGCATGALGSAVAIVPAAACSACGAACSPAWLDAPLRRLRQPGSKRHKRWVAASRDQQHCANAPWHRHPDSGRFPHA